ncbi:MAG: MalY/PatB family protein [Anaerovoracaceae bacterium]
MKYNFDEIIERAGTYASKLDEMPGHCGEGTLPAWIADMDFRCAEPILDAIHERTDRGIFGYTMYDNDDCKNATINWFDKRFSWRINYEYILFSPGIVPGLSFLINLLTRPGDGIIIQQPVYYPFMKKIKTNGRDVVDNSLIYEKKETDEGMVLDYFMNYEDLETKMANPLNKGMILCSPHNPVGRVWSREELIKTLEICRKYNKWIISDEIHCDLTRVGKTHTPLLKLVDEIMPDFRDNVIVCTAPSKTFNIAGLSFSNIIIPGEKIKALWARALNDQFSLGYDANPLSLSAAMAAYKDGDEWLDQLKKYLDDNIEYVKKFVKEKLPAATLSDCQGTYLMWIDMSGYCNDFVKLERAIQDIGKLALDEGYIFGDEGRCFERINIAMPRTLVEECMNRFEKAAKWLEEAK